MFAAAARLEHLAIGPLLRRRLPTFLLIGSPQAATTWLWSNLNLHPDVDVSVKETKYWNEQYHRSIIRYARLYRAGATARGDMTPNYGMLLPERIAVAGRVLPEARLLFIARDPVERAWATIRRKLSDRSPSEAERLLDGTGAKGNLPGVDHSQYHRGLRNWLDVYQRERLLVVPYSQIAVDPERVMTDVLAHIGVGAEKFDWDTLNRDRVNANPVVDIPEEVLSMLEKRYEGERELTERLVGPIDW